MITESECDHRFIYICQEEHLKKFRLNELLSRISPGCEIITVDHITEGAACTVLLAERLIDNEDSLMIANSDQYVDTDIEEYLNEIKSYDEHGFVSLVREKEVISNQATVGIYNYKKGSDFVYYARQMIKKDIRVNREFYVAPVYNEMIEAGKKSYLRMWVAECMGWGFRRI